MMPPTTQFRYDATELTIYADKTPVAHMLVGDGGPDHEAGRLMAAAPELLDMLERVVAKDRGSQGQAQSALAVEAEALLTQLGR